MGEHDTETTKAYDPDIGPQDPINNEVDKNVEATKLQEQMNGVQTLKEENEKLKQTLARYQAMEQQVLQSRENLVRGVRKKLQDHKIEVDKEKKDILQQKNSIIRELLTSIAKSEREEKRAQVHSKSYRLGKWITARNGLTLNEQWNGGEAWREINDRKKNLLESSEAVEKLLKSLKELPGTSDQVVIQSEIYECQLLEIKEDLGRVQADEIHCKLETNKLQLEMNRIKVENNSLFKNYPFLKNRYVVLNLLGKGGFCEVFKGYDLENNKYVACRFQVLNTNPNTRDRHMRFLMRELNIHKNLSHPNIVQLLDSFELEGHTDTFCTILEYCSGNDLSSMLAEKQFLPEKKARLIIIQILNGLAYLNKELRSIIHYDLKPGNILFDDQGCVKVSDFGLSKEVIGDIPGIQLTSPGVSAPECFRKPPGTICSKVDVWSTGVMFYKMLYGKYPFGNGQSKETIYGQGIILRARNVIFPSTPKVSNAAKAFIRRCLTYEQANRPTVLTIAEDPYIKPQQ